MSKSMDDKIPKDFSSLECTLYILFHLYLGKLLCVLVDSIASWLRCLCNLNGDGPKRLSTVPWKLAAHSKY